MNKTKLYLEEVKDKHTNHWDLDLVPRAELERLFLSSEQPMDIDNDKDFKKPKGSA